MTAEMHFRLLKYRMSYAEEGLQVDDAPNEALQGAGQVRGQVRYDLPRSWSGACSTLWRGMQFLMKLLRQKFLRIPSRAPINLVCIIFNKALSDYMPKILSEYFKDVGERPSR